MAGMLIARAAFLMQTRPALWPCRPCCALSTAFAVRLDRWSLVAFHWCLADPELSARAMRALTLGLLRNCSGLKGLPCLNTEDFENFAEAPPLLGLRLRKVCGRLRIFWRRRLFLHAFRTFPQNFLNR